jgi:hypothetical protein
VRCATWINLVNVTSYDRYIIGLCDPSRYTLTKYTRARPTSRVLRRGFATLF